MRKMALVIVGSVGLLSAIDACSASAFEAAPSDAGLEADAPEVIDLDPFADFACIGKVKSPGPSAATIAFDLQQVDPTNGKPIAGVALKACPVTDIECAAPLDTATTDAEGVGTFTKLPLGSGGFLGYFEARYEDEPANLNFQPPIYARFPDYGRYYWGAVQMQILADSAGLKLDPSLGLIGFQAQDCRGFPNGVPCLEKGREECPSYYPGGIVVTLTSAIGPKTERVYIHVEGGRTYMSRTDPATSQATGLGGFINVPPGPVTLTAKVGATGQTLGTYEAFVRANAFSLLLLHPQ